MDSVESIKNLLLETVAVAPAPAPPMQQQTLQQRQQTMQKRLKWLLEQVHMVRTAHHHACWNRPMEHVRTFNQAYYACSPHRFAGLKYL